jgi:predicted PurR-regulated permease PerM
VFLGPILLALVYALLKNWVREDDAKITAA